MKCIFCNSEIDKYSFTSMFLEEDELCLKCRKQLKVKRKIHHLNDLQVETFFEYDGIFKSLLIQYKECYDEALKDVFLYGLKDYINIKYFGYKILFIPSSKDKLNKRGFNHLELIFDGIHLKKLSGLEMREELVQEGKNYDARQRMANNYVYTGENAKKVLIIDDVITTGASLKGAYNAIIPHCSSVKALCLAYKKKTLS